MVDKINNKYDEAIKIIKEDINVARQGVAEGYVKVGMGLSGEKVDNKKAIPQLEAVLQMVEEENKNGEFLMNEKTKNLIKGMQVKIDILRKELKQVKDNLMATKGEYKYEVSRADKLQSEITALKLKIVKMKKEWS